MKEENLLSTVVPEVSSPEAAPSSTGDDVQRHWQGVVKRRSFLKGLGMAGATLSAGTLLATEGKAQGGASEGKLSQGDVALLQFALWAELVESDLWTQYAELGGVGPSGVRCDLCGENFCLTCLSFHQDEHAKPLSGDHLNSSSSRRKSA